MSDESQAAAGAASTDQPSSAKADLSSEALAAANAKGDEYLAGWKRAAADYANLQKELSKQREEAAKYAAAGMIKEFLPVWDGLRDALAQPPVAGAAGSPEAAAVAKWGEGISLIRQRLEKTLAAAGVQAIDEADIPFDPAIHEAVMVEKPADPAQAGQVLKVLQAGYRLHDRILRAAKVVVAE